MSLGKVTDLVTLPPYLYNHFQKWFLVKCKLPQKGFINKIGSAEAEVLLKDDNTCGYCLLNHKDCHNNLFRVITLKNPKRTFICTLWQPQEKLSKCSSFSVTVGHYMCIFSSSMRSLQMKVGSYSHHHAWNILWKRPWIVQRGNIPL